MGTAVERAKNVKEKRASLTVQGYGLEPTFSGQPISVSELIRCYTWYNVVREKDDARRYLIEYVGNDPLLVRAIEQADVITTYGWMVRMMARGAVFSAIDRQRLAEYLEKLRSSVQPAEQRKKRAEQPEKKHSNLLEYYLLPIETAIDKLNYDFSIETHLREATVPQEICSKIASYYEPILAEITDAVEKSDKQVVQAYSIYKKKDLIQLKSLLERIVNGCVASANQVRERKQRKARKKSAEQIFKHFQYLEAYDEHNLTSIDPTAILGAKIVVVYNVARNVVTYLVAADERGFEVQRSMITNVDDEKSFAKRVGRKGKQWFADLKAESSQQVKGKIEMLNTELVRASNRINTNVLLMRAFKK